MIFPPHLHLLWLVNSHRYRSYVEFVQLPFVLPLLIMPLLIAGGITAVWRASTAFDVLDYTSTFFSTSQCNE